MNKTAWLSKILGIGGVLETGAGMGLLAAPSALSSLLLGSPVAGAEAVIARLAGAGVLALGIACWYSRRTPATPAGLFVSRAYLAYNLGACAGLVTAHPPLPGGWFALGGAVLHGLLAAALFTALFGPGKTA